MSIVTRVNFLKGRASLWAFPCASGTAEKPIDYVTVHFGHIGQVEVLLTEKAARHLIGELQAAIGHLERNCHA